MKTVKTGATNQHHELFNVEGTTAPTRKSTFKKPLLRASVNYFFRTAGHISVPLPQHPRIDCPASAIGYDQRVDVEFGQIGNSNCQE